MTVMAITVSLLETWRRTYSSVTNNWSISQLSDVPWKNPASCSSSYTNCWLFTIWLM